MGSAIQKRVGILLPPPNVTLETELAKFLPEEVQPHWSRMPRSTRDVTANSLEEMVAGAPEAARLLSMAGVDLMCFACTSGSFLNGLQWDEALAAKLSEKTGVETITTAGAMLAALAELGVSRVALATPYNADVTAREVKFLEDAGYEVVNSVWLGITDSSEIARVPVETVKDLATRAASKGSAEAVFISCTNLPTFGVLGELERELELPVLSSNLATLKAIAAHFGFDSTTPIA